LNSKKISEFTLPGHHFIRLGKNDMNNSRIINTGFYEILYNGYNSVLKRVIKTIEDDLSSGEVVERVIHQSDYYYFKKDNAIYPAENKKDITAIFSDRKKEVQQFIRKNKLNLRKDKENVLLRIASYLNR
jgi:glutamate 5-kinase